MVQILDGAGSGHKAQVDNVNRLKTFSTIQQRIAEVSEVDGNAYGIMGDYAPAGAATYVVLNLVNDSTTRHMHIERVILQAVGISAVGTGDYFQLGTGVRRSAGGTDISVNAVNLNRLSGNIADITAYDNNPTCGTGTFIEIHRIYPQAVTSPPMQFESNGALILGYLDDLTIRIITSGAGGNVVANVQWFFHTP